MPTGKMVGAAYTHYTSRNLDPQLHTHLIVANVTQLDGKWKALATDYIHKTGFIETVMANRWPPCSGVRVLKGRCIRLRAVLRMSSRRWNPRCWSRREWRSSCTGKGSS